MSILGKLKGVKKRWIFLLIIVLVIAGGAAVRIYHGKNHRIADTGKITQAINREVDLDILYLENFENLKITPDQAKQILPLVARMSSSSDLNLEQQLAQQIYGQLTPAQYATLMDHSNSNLAPAGKKSEDRGRDRRKWQGGRAFGAEHEFRAFGYFNGKGYADPREQAMGNVVVKMLQDRSAGK